ncbi:MAG TPA: T9SS type A sorting domain-containing protein [Ferruginibacter sp.]|nr:T9SS type A sorting domain-containing protein [Ferruginibacter sp.]HMP20565.1 T9SS type A sorting domain-containing protein [Ferruginibacter sp.]
MKKMFTRFFCLLLSVLLLANAEAQNPTIYASVASGSWASAATWETFTNSGNNTPGAQGSGTPAAGAPSGTHFVYIRSGHTITMGGANRSCFGMLVENGAKLWANEAADRRVQLVNGGTGFTYPQSGTLTNNGEIGGDNDGIYFEPGTNCQNVTINGSGSTIVRMLRVPGGLGSASGVLNITIDKNITFTRTNNYALSLIYNPQPTNDFTLTIAAGRTVTLNNASGYFSNNGLGSGSGFGKYTYNINGTLDLSASTQTENFLTAFSLEGGEVNLNVGSTGVIKTGAAFNSSPVAPGVANLTIANGGVVDATLATVMNFNQNAFQVTGTGAVIRSVPGGSGNPRTTFPLGIGGSYNPLSISSKSGPTEVYTVGLTNVPVVPPPAQTLPRAWGIAEGTPGGNADTLRFGWTLADVGGSGFVSDGSQTVYVAGWNGSQWITTPALVTGAGTLADPYVARVVVEPFASTAYILTNTNTTPVAFVNVRGTKVAAGIQLDFGNAIESEVKHYTIEKSNDGRNFTTLVVLQPKSNNGLLNSYSFVDNNPYKGNNFYRVRSEEVYGAVKYSPVVSINTSRAGANVNVYPNPVKGNNVSIQLENLEKAVYNIDIFNNLGQKVFTRQLRHDGNNSTIVADLPVAAKAGVYSVHVTSTLTRYVKSIIVE